MGVLPPRIQAPRALSHGGIEQILIHMENFSTPRAALLPRAVNLATLTVVVAATWWSGEQKPAAQPLLAQHGVTAIVPSAAPQMAGTSAKDSNAPWPMHTTSLLRDGLQPVGYQPRVAR